MKIQDHLDQLRKSSFGCNLAAFGDISSGLILRSSSDRPCPRELLDSLCEDAIRCFALADRHSRPEGTESDVYGASVISFTARRSHVFARNDTETDDVVCAIIEQAQAIDPVLRAARETAEKISEDST
ncbi:hypothetical protein SAMN05443999_109119 [Roseovarius azorensis]|uniref:Roadblock/LC7 domain-containing protein n=1 Tax=Roseovarius azorensis TaxID=1287727 RepID=A0A1H7U0W3_9RHOB|nr:hypothetical protein [Roseovarius azorensis]SEL90419.1 hypothetical protein SAMN05443999_109119 [Roseovarius azorensis]